MLERNEDENSVIDSCHITLRCFNNCFNRNNFDRDRQREAFYSGMNLENYAANFFYSLQFSFLYEGWTVEAMEAIDPTPNWFIDWWKVYGLSGLKIKPYSLHLLKIYEFSEPIAYQSGILYKSVENIVEIEYLHFFHGMKRCEHV